MTEGQSDALSRVERHRLRDIERGLAEDDPDFAAEFDDIEHSGGRASRSRRRKVIGMVVLGVLGVGSIAAGLMLAQPIIGVAGSPEPPG